MRAISINSRNFSRFGLSKFSSFQQFRLFSSDNGDDSNKNNSSFESSDYFERHLFGDIGDDKNTGSFFRKLDKIEKSHEQSMNDWGENGDGNSRFMKGQIEGFDTLSDGMDLKLKSAANTFTYSDEIFQSDYQFRPDVTFYPGTNYTLKDLDLTKPGIQKNYKKIEFMTTTEEVLKKADFRNVRFLANFLTEAGIIIKRSHTKISAKAQRKVAREIKTARALGLMPFTTMGTKPFFFGQNMKDEDGDFQYTFPEAADNVVEVDAQ